MLEVFFDTAGTRTKAAVPESNLEDAARRALTGAVVERLPTRWSRTWGLLLRVEGKAPLLMKVGPVEFCPPVLQNREEVLRLLETGTADIPSPLRPGQRFALIVHVRSDSLGNTVDKRFEQVSFDPNVNAFASWVVDRMKVSPPLLNRHPIKAWSRIPITLTIAAPAPADAQRRARRRERDRALRVTVEAWRAREPAPAWRLRVIARRAVEERH